MAQAGWICEHTHAIDTVMTATPASTRTARSTGGRRRSAKNTATISSGSAT